MVNYQKIRFNFHWRIFTDCFLSNANDFLNDFHVDEDLFKELISEII